MKGNGGTLPIHPPSFILDPCSPGGLVLISAEELGGRRSRLVAGRERQPRGPQITCRIRAATCCRRSGFLGEGSV